MARGWDASPFPALQAAQGLPPVSAERQAGYTLQLIRDVSGDNTQAVERALSAGVRADTANKFGQT
ncbi:unnamed protein product, partial [Symbiodinium sp. KB8]